MPLASNTRASKSVLRRLVASFGLFAAISVLSPAKLLVATAQASSVSLGQFKVGRCEALFASVIHAELSLLDALIADGVITHGTAQEIIRGRDARSILQKLSYEGKISDKVFDVLEDAFVEIRMGRIDGQPVRIPTLKTGDIPNRRSEVYLQKHKSFVADAALSLRDIMTGQVLASIDYRVEGTKLSILIMRVAKQERDQKYSEMLIREMLKQQPDAMFVHGQLGMTNLAVLTSGLKAGLPIEKAILNVPLYKTLVKLGFHPVAKYVPRTLKTSDGWYGLDATRTSLSRLKLKLAKMGYTEVELDNLGSLVEREIITTEIAKRIVDSPTGSRILWDLMASGKITESEFEYYTETFAVLPMGHQIGPATLLTVPPSNVVGSRGPQNVLLQEFVSYMGENGFALLDERTRRPLATLTFEIKGSENDLFWIDLILVAKRERNQGYSELILREVLQKYPEINSIGGRLVETNERVLFEALRGGAAVDAAVKSTPLYKAVKNLGFSVVDVQHNEVANKYRIEVKRARR